VGLRARQGWRAPGCLAGGPFTAGGGDCGHRHAPGGEPGQL